MSRKKTTVSAELAENWILIIIIIIIILMIIIIIIIIIIVFMFISFFRKIHLFSGKSLARSHLVFSSPLSPRNPYCPLLWNTTLVSVKVNYIFIPVEGFSGFGGFSWFFLYFTQCVLATGEWCMCLFWFSPQILNERYKQYHEVSSLWVNPCLLI